MRIGILGGTFNPIHRGHLHIADHARRRLKFDQILFIPTGDPPHKSSQTLAPAHHRLAMVKLAIQDYPYFKVSEIEIFSSGTCYTIDTLHKLRTQIEGELFFLVGLDAFLDLPTWKAADQLLKEANFVVISRPHVKFSQLRTMKLLPPLDQEKLLALDAGTRDQLDVRLSPRSTLTLLAVPPCDISASVIRERLRQGLSTADWLPPSIESYIIDHQIYGTKRKH